MRLVLCGLLFAGSLLAVDYSGRYELQGAREMGSELLLKPDGTFEYMLAYGAADYVASGTWRAENGAVFLNTAPLANPEPFRLTRSSRAQIQGTRVLVVAPNGNPVPNVEVAIESATGQRSHARSDGEGIALFPDTEGAKKLYFSVRVYSLDAGPYEVKPENNDFAFEINGDAVMTAKFVEERLPASGRTLTMTFWQKDHPLRYVKR
jgi:hypothetical protein